MHLVWATAEFLPGYTAALQQGWSQDTQRPEVAQQELARIAEDPAQFIASLDDRAGLSGVFVGEFLKPASHGGTAGDGIGLRCHLLSSRHVSLQRLHGTQRDDVGNSRRSGGRNAAVVFVVSPYTLLTSRESWTPCTDVTR